MKKIFAMLLSAVMVTSMAVASFAAPAVDTDSFKLTVTDEDNKTVAGSGTSDDPFVVDGTKSYTVKYSAGDVDSGVDLADVEIDVSLVETVFATMGPVDYVAQEFDLYFNNAAFDSRTVKVEFEFSKEGSQKANKTFYFSAQGRTAENIFAESNAISAFRDRDTVNIGSANIDKITEGAFSIMRADEARSIVYTSDNFILTFDKDSENLNQDVEVKGNTNLPESVAEANKDATLLAINLPSSTATAKFEIAVGTDFAEKFEDKTLSVYTRDGSLTDIKASLYGNTVKFEAPLGNYIITGDAFTGTDPDANNGSNGNGSGSDSDKDNPSMGGNDFVGISVALAAMSLVAAGAVALKKSK